jgi:hypothetical protein
MQIRCWINYIFSFNNSSSTNIAANSEGVSIAFWVILAIISNEFACKSEGQSIAFWVALAAPLNELAAKSENASIMFWLALIAPPANLHLIQKVHQLRFEWH